MTPKLNHSNRSVNSANTDQAAAWSISHYDSESAYYDPAVSTSHNYAPASAYGAPAEQYSDAIYDNLEYHEMHVELHPRLDFVNCVEDGSGRVRINGKGTSQILTEGKGTSRCDLILRGMDSSADRLVGGLDGRYNVVGCAQGKPMYVRVDGPPNEERCLFFNQNFGDWEFVIGSEPTDDQLVMYSDMGYLTPLDPHGWHLAAALNTVEEHMMPDKDEDLYYIAPNVLVSCAESSEATEL